MDLRRICKHLLTTEFKVGRAFPPEALAAIQAAVKKSETRHNGEIRFAVEGALHSAALFNGQSARERAIEVFANLRVWDTEHNNGVLIYLLLADRDVEIITDRGVDVKVGADAWEAICRTMETAFRQGEYRHGAVAGIEAVAQHLARHFPCMKDKHNELPDSPVML